MHFDDRLTTVLDQPASDPHDRAVRWRQLVELLARSGHEPANDVVARALAAIHVEAPAIDPAVRAAAARAIAGLDLRAELVAAFATDTLEIAAPVLGAAAMSPASWRVVHAAASPANRRFLEGLHPELAGAAGTAPPRQQPPQPWQDARPPAAPAQPAAPEPVGPLLDAGIPSISEVVARIERLRQSRQQPDRRDIAADRPLQPVPGAMAALFRWECAPSGEIAWVEGVPRGALVGRSLTRPGDEAAADPAIGRAFAMRAPFHEASLSFLGEGAVAGEWSLTGMPAFEPADGRFAGYRGIAVRKPAAAAGDGGLSDHDSIRELVHELKTPLTAIIGFAEIIDGQYLGPAQRPYRARARDIVDQATLLLAAIDDLDLAAKLRSGQGQRGTTANLQQLVGDMLGELTRRAAERDVPLTVEPGSDAISCAIDPALGERLVRRFCAALIDAAEPGEQLRIEFSVEAGQCRIAMTRPHALTMLSGEAIAGAIDGGDNELGAAFWLHLVRGLAHLAGGDLIVGGGRLTLTLPQH
ncbi:histidine kinase dimerization/phospho-acceptor domain-containing protein [Sphingomonas sp.]|uniref:sensor histidine kinase n=1 Tax=Sphingomonas sp. TaxID=28214 RepID=UPI00286E9D25|nr:histidine kinase dimerization/phospho-acceptor domain-containing protein [Sphingomonas sp.]